MAHKISKKQIHKHFIEALADSVRSHTVLDEVPLEVQVDPPLPPKLRIYGYNVTTPTGAGSNDKHIARLILPGQNPGERGSFNHSDGHFVLLIGYSDNSGVFILWDAGLHHNFGYAKEVKVNSGPVYEAVAGNIGSQERYLKTGTEKVLTANANNLSDAIERRSELTTERLTN